MKVDSRSRSSPGLSSLVLGFGTFKYPDVLCKQSYMFNSLAFDDLRTVPQEDLPLALRTVGISAILGLTELKIGFDINFGALGERFQVSVGTWRK